MKNSFIQNSLFGFRTKQMTMECFISFLLLSSVTFGLAALDGNKSNQANDDLLIEQYSRSKGTNIISFDASNIKQFWIDKSVFSQDNSIVISLNKTKKGFESVPLKIQLVNVDETRNCRIEVITEAGDDLVFSVLNDKSNILSLSSNEEEFIHYSIISSSFSLEKVKDLSFQIKFSSKNSEKVSIKRMILSFSRNEDYLASPGILKISNSSLLKDDEQGEAAYSFSLTGKRISFIPPQKILITNNTLSTSVKIKNTGNTPTRIQVGFAPWKKGLVHLDKNNYPYNNKSIIMNVISSDPQSNTLIVDTYPNWRKGCYLAVNAKEDMSDIPNTQLIGKIVEIKKFDDDRAEITLEKPFDPVVANGTKVRVHGVSAAYIYSNTKELQPGEESVFTSAIKKDDTFLQYSPKAFSRGVEYIVPVIRSYSVNSSEENTIQISDYMISY